MAKALATKTGVEVRPVSLLHSSNVPAADLEGESARLLEPSLTALCETDPDADVVLLPLFFGPSAALTEYLPARLETLRRKFPDAGIRTCPWLVDVEEDASRLAAILADRVRAVKASEGWTRPRVVLVDHGSPQPAVTKVRDRLGDLLRTELQGEAAGLSVASMERREGDAYAFNEPLLADALRTPPFNTGPVVVALQFLSPGRHAGSGGDIARICMAAEQAGPGLVTRMTEPIAGDPRLLELLAERLGQAAGTSLGG